MILSYEAYRRKMAGCFLGKAVGGTLGMPMEGVLEPRKVTYYDPVPTGMVPNDDLDLQVANLELIRRNGMPVCARHLADFWKDMIECVPDEYGVANRNVTAGLYPPLSGAYANKFYAGMGAAIRSELWACLAPGDPDLAVKLAREDACTDHYGDGVDACVFLTAVESAAFLESDFDALFETAIAYIADNERMTDAFRNVVKWWRETGDTLEVRRRLLLNYGVDNWTDVTINLGIILIGWLAGGGDFGASLCAAVSLGYDGDCTGATLGAILGLINPDGIGPEWTKPIAGALELSSCVVGAHPPESIEGFCDLVAETACETIRYYGSKTTLTGELPAYTGAPAWTKRAELAWAREGTSLVATDPLCVRVAYPEGTAISGRAKVTVSLANPGEVALCGTVSFRASDFWRVSPETAPVCLEPGGEAEIALTVSAPTNALRACKSELDMRFTLNGARCTVRAGLIAPYPAKRVSRAWGKPECPPGDLFEDAEVDCAPSNLRIAPQGPQLYRMQVKSPTKLTRLHAIAQGERPLKMWIGGRLICDNPAGEYVPAMHRCPHGAFVDLPGGWNDVVIEIADGDPGEFSVGFGTEFGWKWITALEWRA